MTPQFLVIDKPPGLTSHDVVAMVRAVTGVKKVGHTGTLDPFATGVLPLALGPATRLIQYIDEDLKIYDATIALGSATDTGDPTGEVIRECPVPALTPGGVEEILAGFSGIRMQEPPRYSAVKVRGRALYKYARAGEDVRAAPRPTRIDGIDLISLEGDVLRVLIRCGRGTYARVLADEIAQELGTTGHLSVLRRTRSGPFMEEGALTLPELSRLVAGREDWDVALRSKRGPDRVQWTSRAEVTAGLQPWFRTPMEVLSHLPRATLTQDTRRLLVNGGAPPPPPAVTMVGEHYLAVDGDEVIAIVLRETSGPKLVRVVSR